MRRGSNKVKLLIGTALVLFAVIKYCSSAETNPYTGKKQHISISETQEIAIGLQSAPYMAEQHGGLYNNEKLQKMVDKTGQRLVMHSIAIETGYQYDFHLLADEKTINAFALPGGQIFITYALFSKFALPLQFMPLIELLKAVNSRLNLQRWGIFLDLKSKICAR